MYRFHIYAQGIHTHSELSVALWFYDNSNEMTHCQNGLADKSNGRYFLRRFVFVRHYNPFYFSIHSIYGEFSNFNCNKIIIFLDLLAQMSTNNRDI